MYYFLLFVSLVIIGVILEDVMLRMFRLVTKNKYKTHHSTIGKYLFLLSLPILTTLLIAYQTRMPLIQVFLFFAFFGTFLEWLIGFFFKEIVGWRLWTYHKYRIGPYTSLLSIPFWGLAGALFWTLIKAFT